MTERFKAVRGRGPRLLGLLMVLGALAPAWALETFKVTLRNRTATPFRVTGTLLQGEEPGLVLPAKATLTLDMETLPGDDLQILTLEPHGGGEAVLLPCLVPTPENLQEAGDGEWNVGFDAEGPGTFSFARSRGPEAPGRCIWTVTEPIRVPRRAQRAKANRAAARAAQKRELLGLLRTLARLQAAAGLEDEALAVPMEASAAAPGGRGLKRRSAVGAGPGQGDKRQKLAEDPFEEEAPFPWT